MGKNGEILKSIAKPRSKEAIRKAKERREKDKTTNKILSDQKIITTFILLSN